MLLRRDFLVIAALAFALYEPAAASREPIVGDASVSYSAVRAVTIDGKTYTGKVFHLPGQERNDQDIHGIAMDFILNLDENIGFVVLPELKTYVEFHIPRLLAELGPNRLRGKAVGEDRIAGLRATKYRLDYTASDGVRGEGYLWVSDNNIIVRIEGRVLRPRHAPMNIKMELTDLRLGAQDPSLFVPPRNMKEIPEEALQALLSLNLKLPGRK
jgi:hypothetical protein